jgi:hypothetical protein
MKTLYKPFMERFMKALLIVIVVIGACVVGLGFYRGWFHVSSENADGNPGVTFSADTAKIDEDKKTAGEKLHNLGSHVKDKAATPADEKNKEKTATPVPPSQD